MNPTEARQGSNYTVAELGPAEAWKTYTAEVASLPGVKVSGKLFLHPLLLGNLGGLAVSDPLLAGLCDGKAFFQGQIGACRRNRGANRGALGEQICQVRLHRCCPKAECPSHRSRRQRHCRKARSPYHLAPRGQRECPVGGRDLS